jgi:hypothetical protein
MKYYHVNQSSDRPGKFFFFVVDTDPLAVLTSEILYFDSREEAEEARRQFEHRDKLGENAI